MFKKKKITKELIKQMNGDKIFLLYQNKQIPEEFEQFALDHVFLNGCSIETAQQMINYLEKISSFLVISNLPEEYLKQFFALMYSNEKEDLLFKIMSEINLDEKIIKSIIYFIIEVNKITNQLLSNFDSNRLLKSYKYMKKYNIEIHRNLLVDEILNIGGKNIKDILCEFKSCKDLLNYLYKNKYTKEEINEVINLYQKEKSKEKTLKKKLN